MFCVLKKKKCILTTAMKGVVGYFQVVAKAYWVFFNVLLCSYGWLFWSISLCSLWHLGAFLNASPYGIYSPVLSSAHHLPMYYYRSWVCLNPYSYIWDLLIKKAWWWAGPCRDLWRGRCSKYKRGTWNTAFNSTVLLADMCIEMDASVLIQQQMPWHRFEKETQNRKYHFKFKC